MTRQRSLDRLAAVVDRDDPDIDAEPDEASGDLGGDGPEACVAEVAEDEESHRQHPTRLQRRLPGWW